MRLLECIVRLPKIEIMLSPFPQPVAILTDTNGELRVGAAPLVFVVLALIGMADAFYDSFAIYTGQDLWCPPPIDGCNIVANSPYARVAGVPLGYFGFVYYLYAFGLGVLLAFDPWSRSLRWGAVLYGAAGVCFSIYFMYVQRTYIHAFCIYCLVSGVLTLLLLAVAVWHYRTTLPHRLAQQGR